MTFITFLVYPNINCLSYCFLKCYWEDCNGLQNYLMVNQWKFNEKFKELYHCPFQWLGFDSINCSMVDKIVRIIYKIIEWYINENSMTNFKESFHCPFQFLGFDSMNCSMVDVNGISLLIQWNHWELSCITYNSMINHWSFHWFDQPVIPVFTSMKL